MKRVLLGLLALLLLNACEQKEEVSPMLASTESAVKKDRAEREATTNKQWTHRLIRKRAVWTEPTKQTVTDLYYTYNDYGQLVMISGTREYGTYRDVLITLSYDELGRLTSMLHNFGLRWDFSYDNKNMVKQVRTYSVSGSVQSESYYANSYNAEGLMTETKTFVVVDGQPEHRGTFTYTYEGENVVKIVKAKPDGTKVSEHNYTHDSGKVPLNNVQNLSVPRYITSDLPGASLSVNNILTEVMTDAAGNRNTINSYSISYEYATAGYPAVATKTFDRGYTERTEYTYETRVRH